MEHVQSQKTRGHLTSEQVRGLLEEESHNLYDYLMRMTGQMERSAETCEEVVRVTSKWVEQDPSVSYKLIRKKFYMTARSFNADIWQGDVENLENVAFADDQDAKANDLKDQFLGLEKLLNKMDGFEREIILLKVKYGFDSQEIKELTKLTEDVDPVLSKSLATLQTKATTADIRDQIAALPLHPKPESVTHHTQALSQLMRDLKSRRSPQMNLALIFGGLAVALVLLLIIRFAFFG